ncbi:MAG: DMT family transporter [Burkholderiales bacterium]|nr:DMT family transporter [Burkholderiales bacterium]
MIIQSLWALAAAASFSAMAALVKLCDGTFGSMELVFYRSLFTVLFLLSVVWVNGYTLRPNYAGWHFLRAVLGFASVGVWFFTLGKMPLGTNVTLTYTTSLFLAVNFIILSLIRHQRPPWGAIGSILLGFLGVIAVMQPTLEAGTEIPALLCLLVALIDLGGYWCIRRLGQVNEQSWRIVFNLSLFSLIGSLIFVLAFEDGFHMPTFKSGCLLLGMGLFATAGMLAATRAWSGGNMLLVSCLGFSAIPFSEIISIVVFGLAPSAMTIAGMCLVVIAGMLSVAYTRAQTAKQELEHKRLRN